MKTDEENAEAGLKGDKVSDSERARRQLVNNKLTGPAWQRMKRRRRRGRNQARARRGEAPR